MMDSYDYYNALHESLYETEKELSSAMRSFDYLAISILKTRVSVIAGVIKDVGKILAQRGRYQPELPPDMLTVEMSRVSLTTFIPAAVTRCVQLECYWLYFKDTPEGLEKYNRYYSLTKKEATLQDFFEGVTRCVAAWNPPTTE